MERLAAIVVSLALTLSVYAYELDFSPESTSPDGRVTDEERAEESGERRIFPSVKRRGGGGGGGILKGMGGKGDSADEKRRARPPVCVTPARGCGYTLKTDGAGSSARDRTWTN